MKIAIQGQDYTATLDAAHPLTIERKLNEPSFCQLWLSLSANSTLPIPLRSQSISVAGDDGTLYFTGYVAVTPLPEYAGIALEGPRYRIAVQAVSDELLLDQSGLAPTRGAVSGPVNDLMTTMVTLTGLTSLSTNGVTLGAAVTNFLLEAGAPWSKSAGQVASQARAAYRALNGALELNSVPGAVHALNETDGSLALANLSFTSGLKRTLANDITVCGEHEPTTYVTEYFLGDGMTTEFELGATPYAPPSARTAIIRELFNENQIDRRLWCLPGGFISLGSGGLVIQGGNGIDGQTLLAWVDEVEMGGTLLLEAAGVTLAAGSDGILPGFFVGGADVLAACIAGFHATAQHGTGTVSLQPIVQGTPTGAIYSVNPANQYALRIRVHCCETERDLSLYRSSGDNGPIAYGGQTTSLPAFLHFEIQEFIDGIASMPVTLFDGAIANLPDTCSVAAVSSISLFGTIRALNLTNLGSGWVVSTPPGGGPFTRRVGTAAEAAECHIDSSGRLVFYTGFAPPVGEQIAVRYRGVARAVGRAVNAASQQAVSQAGLPPVCSWIGSVTSPEARSSQDCRNAAQTLAQSAASVAALWSGTYKTSNMELAADVWPGDALQLNAPSTNLNAQVVVRSVKLSYRASYPDLVHYDMAFANDWANDLAIQSSASVPADADLSVPVNPTFTPNLSNLAVTRINGSSVTIDAGATAPTGGGFEIRRRDRTFMPGQDTDLVMRSPLPSMTFTRVSASDRFYIRMFDGASPPNYSEFSAALFFNVPLGS
jgi:hypothetical protein